MRKNFLKLHLKGFLSFCYNKLKATYNKAKKTTISNLDWRSKRGQNQKVHGDKQKRYKQGRYYKKSIKQAVQSGYWLEGMSQINIFLKF